MAPNKAFDVPHTLAFADGHLVVEIVERHEHRRATIEELENHFSSGTSDDYPAHWFEAQLIHYGLEPSKSKPVARMRLHDALNSGRLTVPVQLSNIESKFRADWIAEHGEKALIVAPPDTRRTTSAAKRKPVGTKRSANDDTDSEFEKGAKKAKVPFSKSSSDRKSSMNYKVSTRQGTETSKHVVLHTRNNSTGASGDGESSDNGVSLDEEGSSEDELDSDLSCLNGRYKISCPSVAENYPHYGSEYDLVFTMAGPSLWANFQFGVVEGVMYFPKRPEVASYGKIPFKWRGRESEGQIMYNEENNTGWIKFLGDSEIEGRLDYMSIEFSGRRRLAPATFTPIDALTMQNRWNGYSEAEYERERAARWR